MCIVDEKSQKGMVFPALISLKAVVNISSARTEGSFRSKSRASLCEWSVSLDFT